MKKPEYYDFLIIGGGLFGAYAALYLAKKQARVLVVEKEAHLFTKASIVNQARMHSGYHYPRSIATAALSDEHKQRFSEEHKSFINTSIEKYYAIDRFGSFTDPAQFERFCNYLDIQCDRIYKHSLFNFDRMEALYRTSEHSFDPVLIGQYYTQKLMETPNIVVMTQTVVATGAAQGQIWEVMCTSTDTPEKYVEIHAGAVINATYAATNANNRIFGLSDIELTHEISEMGFVTSPQFKDKGLTVMDGPFGSIMPYGLHGILSISSVAYTHHAITYDNLPRFDCQQPNTDPSCKPEAPGICTTCARRPVSNAYKMLAQMQQYFSDQVVFEYLHSWFTIKSKMKSSYIDDGRPTEISVLHQTPPFYCLFSGKVNSIYEVEKMV